MQENGLLGAYYGLHANDTMDTDFLRGQNRIADYNEICVEEDIQFIDRRRQLKPSKIRESDLKSLLSEVDKHAAMGRSKFEMDHVVERKLNELMGESKFPNVEFLDEETEMVPKAGEVLVGCYNC